jgi:DNA invertase Pin-like site-specific DNA recombinase
VAQEYVDVETAKQTGRTAFGEMIAYLKAHPAVRVMLVEKTDRLYRNLKDWVTVDELEVEIHFPKEGVVLSRDSRSSEKFMHGIKVLMAKNYIDNLSEEARKGMQEKAEQGIWPTNTPLGYRNTTGWDGKKIIAADPAVAPIVTKLFEWYATGQHSLKEAARRARGAGLVYRKSGAKVPVSTVHSILRNRLYTGWFQWNGKLYQGKHEPLVPVGLWERVQEVLDCRSAKKHRRMRHDFAFSGLIACGKCGCSVVGEIKKQRYVYYHCTGYADKCQGNLASCRRKYVREEVLEGQFTELLGRLRFDDELLGWVREALQASHADQRRDHQGAIARLQAEYKRLDERIHAMYVDKLDGKIGGDFYDRFAGEWREEQRRLQLEIDRHQQADESYMDEGLQILELARNAQMLFEHQPAREKRRLLNFVLSNCSWEDGTVRATFRQPFDLLAETTGIAAGEAPGNAANSAKSEIWLAFGDSNSLLIGRSGSHFCYGLSPAALDFVVNRVLQSAPIRVGRNGPSYLIGACTYRRATERGGPVRNHPLTGHIADILQSMRLIRSRHTALGWHLGYA